jgi:acid phosphatase
MMHRALAALALLSAGLSAFVIDSAAAQAPRGLDNIDTVVVIYAENRSFDNLYGHFPGADGLQNVTPEKSAQVDRDGSALKELPPVWGNLTAKGVTPAVTEKDTADAHLPNRPFAIDDPKGFNVPLAHTTRDLWHLFYRNQMQINGGKNDRFVAYADSGALVMGHYDGSKLPLWNIAKQYTLADNFFMGAFGGSFLNHFWLACACTPIYPGADKKAANLIAVLEADNVTLKLKASSHKSALQGPPEFVNDKSQITPDFYAVNTLQPPYQPSKNKPAKGGDPAYADPEDPTTLPPQHEITIGDLLSLKGVSWAWYGGAWQAALDGKGGGPVPEFQFHHQPFNYFAAYAPGTPARAQHLLDGGMNGAEFIKAIDSGKLPQVAFYKPQGNLNEHPGYAEVMSGDEHIADLIAHLQKSPQWAHMLVIVTYDENGGFWDHVAPPKADRWGPGSRIPALIVSPFAKKGYVDHTQSDTTSILRFITKRFDLPVLPGLIARDAALKAHGHPPMGDLTEALTF